MAPSGLYARLCHAFSSLILNNRLSQRRPCLSVNALCIRWLPIGMASTAAACMCRDCASRGPKRKKN